MKFGENKKYRIIDFEGLDCSFKETNYKKFIEQLKLLYGNKVLSESFPRYNKESSYGIKLWLNGKLNRDYLKTNPDTISILYYLDRISYWDEIISSEENITRYDLLTTENYIFCFDRYTISDIIYNSNTKLNDVDIISDFSKEYNIAKTPSPDIVIWMRMRSFDVLTDIISKKQNKDKNELDINMLHEAWKRSEYIIKNNLFEKNGIKTVIVECLDENNNIKPEDEIFSNLWEDFQSIYKY